MESLKKVISEIQVKVTSLKEQLSKMSSDNERMTQTIVVLEKRLEEKQTELNDSHTKIEELSIQSKDSNSNNENVDGQMNQEDIEALVREIDDCIIRLKNK